MRIIYSILLLLVSFTICAQQNRIIQGNVKDEAGIPLLGASVYLASSVVGEMKTEKTISNNAIGTVTDIEGNFKIDIPANVRELTVSYIGFKTKKIYVTRDKKFYNITLEEDGGIELSEVILTGYQKIESRKATSSHKIVEGATIKQAASPNVDQMLAGQISGVSVMPTNGSPGAPAKIQIRGITTLNGSSDPLWVVDGIPLEGNAVPESFDKDNIDNLTSYPIAGINPDDIESITVLKDASATSIYGARASNGVIVITTKSGKKGALSVRFSANTFMTAKPDIEKLNLMDANEKVDFELFLASRPDLKYQSDRGSVARILNSMNEYDLFQKNGFDALSPQTKQNINNLRNKNTNWGNQIYQSTINTNYNVNVSGGSDRVNYYASLGYYKQEGTVKKTQMDRYTLTLKNDFSITDKLKLKTTILTNRNINKSYVSDADAYTNPLMYLRRVNPYHEPYNADGGYAYDPDLIEINKANYKLDFNVLEEQDHTFYKLISNSVKPILDVEYKFNKDLTLSTQLGFQLDFDHTEKTTYQNSYYTRKYRLASRYYNSSTNKDDFYMPNGGITQNWENHLFQYNWKTLANYSTKIAIDHELDIMLGTELRRNNRELVFTRGFGFNPNTLLTTQVQLPIGLEDNSRFRTFNKTIEENAFSSFFSTASYTYKRKYTLFGSLRYDGSNLFGVNPEYRYLPIWSLAGNWNLGRENFMQSVKFIDDFTVRASYGVQGNIDKTTSPFVIGFYDSVSILPNTKEEILRVDNAPNKNLRWEKTVSSNIGIDLGLFNNSLYIVADYYMRKSTDLIGLRSSPLESGFGFLSTNWASISNYGYELAITTKNINKKSFKWTTNFNISHNTNKVERVQAHEKSLKPSLEGYSASAVFGIKTAGIDPSGLPIFVKDDKQVSAVDFYNLNKGTSGSQLTPQEHRDLYTYMGDATPMFTGGLINTFTYKNISLQVAANFNLLQTVRETPPYHPTLVEPGYNYSRAILKAGTGNYPALIGAKSPGLQTKSVYNWFNSGDDGHTFNDLDIWIKQISYLRINNIRLNYAFEKETLKNIGVKSFDIMIEGRNLFVFGSDYTGYFDPETYGSLYAQPIPKTISLGFNVSF